MHRQLDIFDDSRDVALRNDLAQALLGGDPLAARRIADTLQAEFGADPVLVPAAALIEHQHWRQSLAEEGRLDVTAVLDARRRLDGPVAASAAAVSGAREAAAWLADEWRWLAGQASGIGWHPAHAEAHAAALYLRGQAWPQATEAVARIDSWRRIPVPLLWMTQARWRGDGADAAWPLLAEAFWLTPARAAALLPALSDTRLDRLVARFEERFAPCRRIRCRLGLAACLRAGRPAAAGRSALARHPTDTDRPGQCLHRRDGVAAAGAPGAAPRDRRAPSPFAGTFGDAL
jgi:hypothetical protein